MNYPEGASRYIKRPFRSQSSGKCADLLRIKCNRTPPRRVNSDADRIKEYYETMKLTLIALTLLVTLQLASAQQKISREEALAYARAVSADAKQLNGTPIATDVDPQQPVALKEEDYGSMVLPQKNLKPETIARAGETAVPIGQLWLHKLAPMRNGEVVGRDSLRLVTVQLEGEDAMVPQCALAVRRNAAGALELLVFGKGKEPLLTVALKPLDAKQLVPIDLEAKRDGDEGKLTFKILGKYEATISLTELQP